MSHQYLLSVHGAAGAEPPPQAEMERAFAQVDAFNEKLKQSGAWVFAGGLHPADTATVVRVHEGQTITTDGPFVEAKEHLGGFWVIRAEDLDAALKLAAEASEACMNPVEVRPFQDE